MSVCLYVCMSVCLYVCMYSSKSRISEPRVCSSNKLSTDSCVESYAAATLNHWICTATMMSIAPAVFDPGRPSAHFPSTCQASPDPFTPSAPIQQPVEAKTNGFTTHNSPTHALVGALRKHSFFFESFATTPRRRYYSDPLDEALHLRPYNLYYPDPITFDNPYPFYSDTSGTTPDPFTQPTLQPTLQGQLDLCFPV
jgi:hypothetical protein